MRSDNRNNKKNKNNRCGFPLCGKERFLLIKLKNNIENKSKNKKINPLIKKQRKISR